MHRHQINYLTAILMLLLAGTVVISTVSADPLPSNRHIFFHVANDAGVKYDLDGAYYGPAANNTYYIKADGGGLNELHLTNAVAESYGQVTDTPVYTTNPSGTFWMTNTGGRGFDDDLILLIAVNGTLPADFSVHIRTSGYVWTLNSTPNAVPTDYHYEVGLLNETFTAADFTYGPQTWKPGPGALGQPPYLPLFFGQNQGDGQEYNLMFVDLNVGNLKDSAFPSLIDAGGAKVEFQFHNLTSVAAFNGYGWLLAANQGQGISWTNRVADIGASGYKIQYFTPDPPTAGFAADRVSGPAPFTVNFTDTSIGDGITGYRWVLGDNPATVYSTMNLTHTFVMGGTYAVSHAAINAGGTSWKNETAYITVSAAPAPNVTSMMPPKHKHDGKAFTATVTGTGFWPGIPGTQVTLTKKGARTIRATNMNIASDTSLACSFKIPKTAKTGAYKVSVINPDGQQGIPGAFRVAT